MPHSRVALETGTHSPWVSRLLDDLGHEVIVAHARNVRLIRESRRKGDRVDARTLARIDPDFVCENYIRRRLYAIYVRDSSLLCYRSPDYHRINKKDLGLEVSGRASRDRIYS